MQSTKEITLAEALRDLNLSMNEAVDFLKKMGYDIEPSPRTLIDQEIYNVLIYNLGKRTTLQEAFDSSLNKVIAVKDWKKDYSIGFLKPLRFFENEIRTRGLNREERETLFKNSGNLIVKKNYFEIDERFEETEFFSLSYEEDSTFYPNSKISAKYCSVNSDSSTCRKLPLIIPGNISQVLDEGNLELPYSHHSFAFIKEGNRIFGPISVQQVIENEDDQHEIQESYKYSIQPLPIKYFRLDQNYENVIFAYEENDIEDYIVMNNYGKSDSVEYYISNPQHLVENVEYITFILNEKEEDIIDLINRQLPEDRERRDSWVSSSAADNEITRTRFKKYLELKNKTENWMKFIEEYLETQFLTTPEGKKEVENYIKRYEEKILNEYRDHFEAKIKEELDEETEMLRTTQEEKKRLESEIKVLKDESNLIKSKSEEFTKVEFELNQLIEKLELVNEIKVLKEQKDQQYKVYEDVAKQVEKYEDMLRELQEQYTKESETSMRKKLIELQPYVSALNGFSVESKTRKPKDIPVTPIYTEEEVSITTILESFIEYLQKNNRSIKSDDALNYLTNIQQNFLTIFSGLPGVGKTSLATHLSNFFTSGKTFRSIPVSRGWNSRKNLLGYYNPISESYQNDEFGFLELLQWFNLEEEEKNIPAMILLDESNLSPMEHYWSDFISISDQNQTERFIAVGEEKVNVPQGLRFISTINSDHTTEVLSPRLIDRAAIIQIPYSKPSEEGIKIFNEVQNFVPDKIFSQDQLNQVFNSGTAELNRNEQKIFNEIISVLNDEKSDFGPPIFVSHRKIKLIYNYCHTTRDVYFDINGNQLLNLDFSISQHVLPLINGQGTRYENRLNALQDVLEEKGLFRSQKELNGIIARGQDYKNFSFF